MRVMMMDSPFLRRTSSLPFQKLDREILVVDPRTRAVHLLNATASRVWELLESASTGEQVVTVLSDEFDAPVAAIRSEVSALLADLEAKGLVGLDPAHEEARP